MSKMQEEAIHSRRIRNIGIVQLRGELAGEEASLSLERAISKLVDEGCEWIICDMEPLDFIDLGAAAALAANWVRLQINGGNIILYNVYESIGNLLIERYETELAIAGSEEEAMAKCQKSVSPTDIEGSGFRRISNQLWLRETLREQRAVIEIVGALFTQESIKGFGQVLQDLITQGIKNVVIDCGSLASLHADAFSPLFSSLKTLRSAGGGLRLARVQGVLGILISTMGLNSLLPCYETVEEAISAARDASAQ